MFLQSNKQNISANFSESLNKFHKNIKCNYLADNYMFKVNNKKLGWVECVQS